MNGKSSFFFRHSYIPDVVMADGVENALDLIESGIRYGAVVQKYNNRGKADTEKNTEIHKVYFYNPSTYNLSKLPPHIVFDGTKIPNKFIEIKWSGVQVETMNIEVEPIWETKVWQNFNTDLATINISKDNKNVMRIVRELMEELGTNRKYLFISSKATHDKYLKDNLHDDFGEYDYNLKY